MIVADAAMLRGSVDGQKCGVERPTVKAVGVLRHHTQPLFHFAFATITTRSIANLISLRLVLSREMVPIRRFEKIGIRLYKPNFL